MLSKLFKISPIFLKHLWIFSFKMLRKTYFRLNILLNPAIGHSSSVSAEQVKSFELQRRYGPLKHICYAPYSSIFFNLEGQMSPCYASYNENSDVFPHTSIKEAWTKGNFATIRKEHKSFQLEKNCSFCLDFFKNKAYGSMLSQKYEHFAFSSQKFPRIMEFELGNSCSLECIMCDERLSSAIQNKTHKYKPQARSYDDNFIEQLKEFIPHLQIAEFTGGDPFLINIYYKIWDLIITINPLCDILIATNANTMNEKIIALMKRTSRLHFNVSIDAVSKEAYEAIRINGNFEKAMTNIDIFFNYCKKNKTDINLLVCPMTVNVKELPEIIRFANAREIGVYFHNVVKPQHLSLKYLDPETLEEHIVFLHQQSFNCRTFIQKRNLQNYSNLIILLETWKENNNKLPEEVFNETTLQKVYSLLKQNKKPEIQEKILQLEKLFEESPLSAGKIRLLETIDIETLSDTIVNLSFEELIAYLNNLGSESKEY
ncbi:MAG: radical SAM protein [Bacteroidales bacterium]|nr:radical SAM protein [Bacteroidales bacterium]